MKLWASANGLMIEDQSIFPQLYVRDELTALLDNQTSEYSYKHDKNMKHLWQEKHQLFIESIEQENVDLEFLFFTYLLGYIQWHYPYVGELYLPVTWTWIKNAMRKSVEQLGDNFLLAVDKETIGSSIHINRRNGNHLFET